EPAWRAGPRRADLAAAQGRVGSRGRVARGPAPGGLVAAARAGPGDPAWGHADVAGAQLMAGGRVRADVLDRSRPGVARPGPGRRQRAGLRPEGADRGPAAGRPHHLARGVG